MGEARFFDEVASVGGEILEQLRGRTDATPFLLRVRDVYRLLVEIHDDIMSATIDVGAAGTLDEGRSVLRSLHHESLESVFRARRWCDELEALGRDLGELPSGVDVADAGTWDQFTSTLQQREGEVAWLYEEAMYHVLSTAERAATLDDLKAYVDSVSEELVQQKAQFDLLAKRAAALARRR